MLQCWVSTIQNGRPNPPPPGGGWNSRHFESPPWLVKFGPLRLDFSFSSIHLVDRKRYFFSSFVDAFLACVFLWWARLKSLKWRPPLMINPPAYYGSPVPLVPQDGAPLGWGIWDGVKVFFSTILSEWFHFHSGYFEIPNFVLRKAQKSQTTWAGMPVSVQSRSIF